MKKTQTLFILIILLLPCLLLAASPPSLLNYQGVLRDGSGVPRDGSFDMIFRLYSAESTGTLLLTDTHNSSAPSGQVTVINGLFNTQVGAGTIAPAAENTLTEVFRDNDAVWLEVQVDAETLSPRVRVVASAYTQNAKTLDGNNASAFAQADHMQTVSAGGTGLTSPGTSGNVLTSNGTAWVSSPASAENDGVVGNEVTNVTDSTLLRSGSGTGASPYTLSLNLNNANTWTGNQTFSSSAYFPSSGVWNTSGNVGIGTNSPGFPLNFATTLGDKIALWGNGGEHYGLGIQTALMQIHTNNSSASIAFGYGSSNNFTENMRIKGNGKVGIGIDNPAYTLDVAGDTRVSGAMRDSDGDAGTNGQIMQSTATGTNWVDASSFEGDGVVGNEVTNTTDSTLLRSGSGTEVSPLTLSLNLDNANTWTGDQTFSASTYFPSSGVWNNSGNVGIGTTSPGFPLNFANTTGDKISLYGNSEDHYGFGIQSYLMQIYTSDTDADIAFGYGTSEAMTETMRIKGNGNVLIGTNTSAAKLTIDNTLAVNGTLGDYEIVNVGDLIWDIEYSANRPWQSWTNIIAGTYWTGVSLDSHSPKAGTSGQMTLKLYEGEGTGGTLLTQQIITVPDNWGWHSFTIMEPPQLLANTKYTLQIDPVLSYDHKFIRLETGNPYALGRCSNSEDQDFRFKIYAALSYGVGFKVNGNGSVGIRTEDTQGYALAVNGTAAKTGGGSFSSFSDLRLKDLHGHYTLGLKEILALKPYHYMYKDGTPLKIISKGPYVGPLAQEVRKVIPEAVEIGTDGYLLVNNDPILWAMVNAIKELNARFESGTEFADTVREKVGDSQNSLTKENPTGDKSDSRSEERTSTSIGRLDNAQRYDDFIIAGSSDNVSSSTGPTIQVFPAIDEVLPGYVVVLASHRGDALEPCSMEADPLVVGVIPGDWDQKHGDAVDDEGQMMVPVVMSGVTIVRADALDAPIIRGDLLVASPTLGHAMKAQPVMINGMTIYQQGTIIGKAIDDLYAGTGMIRILVMLR